jgi:hypothetical protein
MSSAFDEERMGAASLWMEPTDTGVAAASNGSKVRLRKPFMPGRLNREHKGSQTDIKDRMDVMDDEDRMGKERREVRRKTGAVSLI